MCATNIMIVFFNIAVKFFLNLGSDKWIPNLDIHRLVAYSMRLFPRTKLWRIITIIIIIFFYTKTRDTPTSLYTGHRQPYQSSESATLREINHVTKWRRNYVIASRDYMYVTSLWHHEFFMSRRDTQYCHLHSSSKLFHYHLKLIWIRRICNYPLNICWFVYAQITALKCYLLFGHVVIFPQQVRLRTTWTILLRKLVLK